MPHRKSSELRLKMRNTVGHYDYEHRGRPPPHKSPHAHHPSRYPPHSNMCLTAGVALLDRMRNTINRHAFRARLRIVVEVFQSARMRTARAQANQSVEEHNPAARS